MNACNDADDDGDVCVGVRDAANDAYLNEHGDDVHGDPDSCL